MAHTGSVPLQAEVVLELEKAVKAAGKMAQVARKGLEVELKPDGSVVTHADRDIETFLRAELTKLVPGTTVWGEEFGFEDPGPAGSWLVDPIDGTTNYSVGQPLWGITVAYMFNGRLEAGAVSIPDLDWVFRAALGDGAFLNGMPLPQATEGPIMPHQLVGEADDGPSIFEFLPGKRRHLGAFVAEAMFLAKGYFRAMTCTKAKLYDAAGSLVVLRELGLEVRA